MGRCQIRTLCGPQTPPTGLEVWLNLYSERHRKRITCSTEPVMALFHCMVRHGTVQYGSLLRGFPLGTVPGTFFSTTSAEVTVTKTWRVNSADHWLAEENSHCLRHWTCGTRHRTDPLDLNQHSQWRIERNCFEWAHLSFNNQKMAVSLSVEEVQTFLSLIVEEQIQRERDGVTRNKKFFRSHSSRGGATITTRE